VHLSFDDGYADNCLHAIPALLTRKIPFTYYVTTHNVRNGKPFPHDLKNGQPLAPNSIEEIRAMADAGVEIGVHTRTHPNVAQLRKVGELEAEIRGARADLADWIGHEPRHFAFPFGLEEHLSPRAIQYVHDEGFSSYTTAHGGYNFPFDGQFHLKRFHGDPNFYRVKNWLSFDPRWVHARSTYGYLPFQRPPRAKMASGARN
jgi:peptidoglycan/xylan/chitin deacetylase (PgdA/CDA1 family)